jgi:hypothetical protein
MRLTIWVDDWQIQCCGESFAPGDVVSWHLLEVDPEDYADLLGSDRAAEIDFCEEHHGREDEHAPTRLRVLTITEVHCRYEVRRMCGMRYRAQPNGYRSEKRTDGQ